MMDRYADLTDDIFDAILEDMVSGMTAAQLLSLPGVYDILREELNNDILSIWEEDHPQPDDEDEDMEE